MENIKSLVILIILLILGCTHHWEEDCESDIECQIGWYCNGLTGACDMDCASSYDCPEDWFCDENGQCRFEDGSDVDVDVDSDADSDADTDTDTDADMDADSDVDTDTDTNCADPTWTYPEECVGDICTPDVGCCDGAICSLGVYPEDDAGTNVGWYCYAVPGTDSPNPSGCACGDTTVSLAPGPMGTGAEWVACAGRSTASCAAYKAKVLERLDVITQLDITLVKTDVVVEIGKATQKEININIAFAFPDVLDLDGDGVESDEVYYWMGQGQIGFTEAWSLCLLIASSEYRAGRTMVEPTWQDTVSGEEVLGYAAYLEHMTISGTTVSRAWIEAVATGGAVTVDEPGQIGGSVKAAGSFDLQFADVRVELEPEER